ncbi:MAG: NAD(P)(+) transhydrogenase (Re/Si-specific) subunit beta [Planctomycetota bacterium]
MTAQLSVHVVNYLYLFSAVLFVWGIKSLASPETARRGMNMASLGTAVAVFATLFNPRIYTGGLTGYYWIFGGMAVGAVIGAILAQIPMTAVPQRTALSHAGGAMAACLIGISEYLRMQTGEVPMTTLQMSIIALEVMLASLTVTGSLMAAGKLQELLPGRPMTFKGQNYVSFALLAVLLVMVGILIHDPASTTAFWILLALGFLFGLLLVLPIGAADMPCVISLLNSYAGLTDAVMGFMVANRIQIITGSLDGSSGFILTILMCRAMNRSIFNILFGAFGQVKVSAEKIQASAQTVRKITAEETVEKMKAAKFIIVVPGYGMAAAQAHHPLRELADLLKEKGAKIRYAIHPVAGRMPGHMNVLLAEANVPYTELIDMEEINPEFPEADIAFVMGANDVTNPAARHAKDSPIYGMPILDVDKAKMVIVCKRSMSPGFAGIDNELYYQPQTYMLFGDGKATAEKLVQVYKAGN